MKKLTLILIFILIGCSNPPTNINEIPFIQYNNLPIITLEVNGKMIRLLVDTGSTQNILDSNSKNYLNFSTIETYDIINGIGGHRNLEIVNNVTVKYRDSVIKIDFVAADLGNVANSLGIKGIVGSNFLEENGYLVDFVNNKLIRIKDVQ